MIEVIKVFLQIVEFLTAFLLVCIILVQKSKGGGLGAGITGGSMGESIFGAQMGNVLTKTTIVLSVIFLVNTTILAMIGTRRGRHHSVVEAVASPVAQPAQQRQMPQQVPATQNPVNSDSANQGLEGNAVTELPAAAPSSDATPVVIPPAESQGTSSE